VLTSLIFSYIVFVAGMKINIRKFFYFTSILLILLAGGLAGYGAHELTEYLNHAGVELGWLGDYAYVLNIPSDSPLHHKGLIGSILAVMFGYAVKAEWIRVIIHLVYLAVSLPLGVKIYRKQ